MTRRELGIVLAAAMPIPAQEPADDVEKAAREQVARAREALRKIRVPVATEPSFVFRP
jgi:hypothetical protein